MVGVNDRGIIGEYIFGTQFATIPQPTYLVLGNYLVSVKEQCKSPTVVGHKCPSDRRTSF